ncbi:MAG: HAD-IA family hydrolase, partial [Curvibacter sp.]
LKKPHPMVYQQILQLMQLDPGECLAFEDSGNGLKAATLAGLATVITPTRYTRQHDFSRALQVLPDLAGTRLADLQALHAAHWSGERLLAVEV